MASFLKLRRFRRQYQQFLKHLFIVLCLLLVLLKLAITENGVETTTSPSMPSSTTSTTALKVNNCTQSLRQSGTKKTDILFLKTHKCGTSTLFNVFCLYGVRRRLNFITEPFKMQLNITAKLLVPPRPGEHYNVQCAHATFNPHIAHRLLPKHRTFYSTIVRSPVKRFRSAFSYFGIDRERDKSLNMTFDDSINYWIRNDPNLIKANNTNSVHLSHYVNSLANDLGFAKYMENRSDALDDIIADFVVHLEREFDFVLITDYFDESLVLLKTMMGWEYRDIIYITRMRTRSERKDDELRLETEELIKRHNKVDVAIYHFFYQLFRVKEEEYGEERLQEDVAEFKKMKSDFTNNCLINSKSAQREPSCAFLYYHDLRLANIVTQLQLTDDMKAEDWQGLMKPYISNPNQLIEDDVLPLVKLIQDNFEKEIQRSGEINNLSITF